MTVSASFLEGSSQRLEEGIDRLSRFSGPGPGITRLSFTPEYDAAISYLAEEFEALGFETGYDPVGNFVAANVQVGERCMALGSHVDSVPHGGRFDGTAGLLCALEVARAVPETSLKVFSFVEEEGARFGSGILGGRCVAGLVSAEDLEACQDDSGKSFYEAATESGHDPGKVRECPESLAGVEGYFEVHIEQGRVLEEGGEEVGIVESIAGVVHATLEVGGRADHAGATPMHLRSDAGLTASEIVVELKAAASEAGGSVVGTAGRLDFHPGAINVVPGRATVSLDIRDVETERRDGVLARTVGFATACAEARGQRFTYREHLRTPPVPMAPEVVEVLGQAARRNGILHRAMPSGAGHDAMMMAKRVPTGMLFVPSRDGISHAPEEFTESRHLARAVAVLLEALGERLSM